LTEESATVIKPVASHGWFGRRGPMMNGSTCIRLIVIFMLVIIGAAVVRNVTAAFEEAVSGNASVTTANR
jgi:hypothetical protein